MRKDHRLLTKASRVDFEGNQKIALLMESLRPNQKANIKVCSVWPIRSLGFSRQTCQLKPLNRRIGVSSSRFKHDFRPFSFTEFNQLHCLSTDAINLVDCQLCHVAFLDSMSKGEQRTSLGGGLEYAPFL